MAAVIVVSSACLSVVAYLLTAALIPRLAASFIAVGLKGKDMLKGTNRGGGGAGKSKRQADGNGIVQTGWPVVPVDRPNLVGEELPESTGLIAGGVYVLVLSLFAPIPFYKHFRGSGDNSLLPLPGTTAFSPAELCDWGVGFPHASLSTHLASLFSLLVAVFLGFLDDLFDIRWRFKLPIPIIASIPLLMTYAASLGITDVILPKVFGLRKLLGIEETGGLVKLGPLYYLYMSMLSTFCTNSINILAGVNGVEVGQSLVIALSIVVNDLLHLKVDMSEVFPFSLLDRPVYLGMGLARGSAELQDRHLFSLYFMLPLIGVMLALLKYNWYPARAFIGDTFCYFAGMTIAVVGILGHFSKTLLLFFLPQTFNFLYSCPQLFGIVPIPRHRLPSRDPKRDVLEPSTVLFVDPPKWTATLVLSGMAKFGLVRLERTKAGQIISCTNLTLLNLVLLWRGPMREDRLTMWIMGIQAAGSAVAFGIRYGLAWLFYDESRR